MAAALSALPTTPSPSPVESSQAPPNRPESNAPAKGASNPSAAIAVAVVAGLLVVVAAAALFLTIRRRKRTSPHPHDSNNTLELGPKADDFSPVADKLFSSDPFMTDAQARSIGIDLSRQSTRRIEVRFAAQRTESPQPRSSASASSRKLISGSRSGTPDINEGLVVKEDPAMPNSRRPTPSPSPLPLHSGPDSDMNEGTAALLGVRTHARTRTPSPATQTTPLQPKMQELIVQLGLEAGRSGATTYNYYGQSTRDN